MAVGPLPLNMVHKRSKPAFRVPSVKDHIKATTTVTVTATATATTTALWGAEFKLSDTVSVHNDDIPLDSPPSPKSSFSTQSLPEEFERWAQEDDNLQLRGILFSRDTEIASLNHAAEDNTAKDTEMAALKDKLNKIELVRILLDKMQEDKER